jgi:competence protein ComEC
VRAGERWRFAVRLRRPHGSLNPHGFDYEAWLFERGIRATGYVRMPGRREEGVGAERLQTLVPRPGYLIDRFREAVREKILGALPEHPYAGVLIALAIGDRARSILAVAAVRPHRRDHLMSISGRT